MGNHGRGLPHGLTATLALILALCMVHAGWAHSADAFFHTHTIHLSTEGITIAWEMSAGPMLAEMVWRGGDLDDDGIVTESETMTWLELRLAGFGATLDGERLQWEIETASWPATISGFLSGDERIRVGLRADWPITLAGPHTLRLEKDYGTLALLPRRAIGDVASLQHLNSFELHALDGVGFGVPDQDNELLAVSLTTDRATADGDMTLQTWESGQPSVSAVTAALGLQGATTSAGRQGGTLGILEGLVRTSDTSPLFFVGAWVAAMILGALHALSPGHGKTVVAAYLVGSQGKLHHAVALGGIVTVTHTGSVFVLGLVTLVAAQTIMPTNVLPLLELLSGLLIAILGIGLLIPRLRLWHAERQNRRRLERQPVRAQDEPGGRTRITVGEEIRESGPRHSHDPSSSGAVPRRPSQGNPLADLTWRSLITLGISGGLVPCPDAIALLLISITIKRLALGLSMIVFFSLGLAIVLIAIGAVIVKGQRLFERLRWFDRVATITPILSASAVLLLGLGLVFRMANGAGWLAGQQGLGGQGAATNASAEFEPERARVIFISRDGRTEGRQLFTVSFADGAPRQLTHEPRGLWSFAVSPGSDSVAYATLLEPGGSAIVLLDPLSGSAEAVLTCTGDILCADPVWMPGGQRLLYTRQENVAAQVSAGFPTIWWLDSATGDTGPLFQDAQLPGQDPRVSPDGHQLSYTAFNPSEVHVLDLLEGTSQSIPTQFGGSAVWSPDGAQLLFTDLVRGGDAEITHLFQCRIASGTVTDLTPAADTSDASPAWSPDGERVAVVRRGPAGSQIVLLKPDGAEIQAVTHDTNAIHGRPVWSPDGRWRLFTMTWPDAPEAGSVIRALDVVTGETIEISVDATLPAWLTGPTE